MFVCFIFTGILFFTSLALSLSRLQIILNTSSEDFQRRLAVFYVWKESLPRGGIFFITTLPSPTGVTSTAGVSFLFFTTTSCFWVPLKQFFLFKVLLFTPDCFFSNFWHDSRTGRQVNYMDVHARSLFYFAKRNKARKARYKKKRKEWCRRIFYKVKITFTRIKSNLRLLRRILIISQVVIQEEWLFCELDNFPSAGTMWPLSYQKKAFKLYKLVYYQILHSSYSLNHIKIYFAK